MDDRRGTLNFVDAAATLRALALPRTGQVFSLNRPITGRAGAGRPPLDRRLRMQNDPRPLPDGARVVVNDEVVELALQGWSHWDSLAHMGLVEPGADGLSGVFHGGPGLAETSPQAFARTLGIDAFGPAIITRGVLVDLVGGLAPPGADHLDAGVRIDREMVEACLRAQKVGLERGDVVALYTGFENRVPDVADRLDADAGVDGSTMALWEEAQVAALGADNLAVEAIPIDYAVHVRALRDLGMPLGELWALRDLAAACRGDRRYEFLFVSVPLSIPGAFGSPLNGVAVR